MQSSQLVRSSVLAATIVAITAGAGAAGAAGNLREDFDVQWGDDGKHARFLDGGDTLSLTLDAASGARVQSRRRLLFGRVSLRMKLVPGYSAGTVTTFYLSSEGPKHDEIDLEFLGNVTGQPYVLHTNIFAEGKGDREQQFYLWFDPTLEIHNYTVLWNALNIIIYVDDVPVRQFKNYTAAGVAFPSRQPLAVYASIWNGEDWATRGGRDRIDWSKAPFTASYYNYTVDVCRQGDSCSSSSSSGGKRLPWWMSRTVDGEAKWKWRWFRSNYMIYDYCKDKGKYQSGFPVECSLP